VTGNAPPLSRILGLGFGLAISFGGTIGVGILRLPGTLAASLGDGRLIVPIWLLGGAWALLGALQIAELAAMLPQAGGFYVFARRAFGDGAGFVVGWSDWVNMVAAIAYVALTAATFVAILWPAAAITPRIIAISLIATFAILHGIGLGVGEGLTRLVSSVVGLLFITLIAACYWARPAHLSSMPPPVAVASHPLWSAAMLAPIVGALRTVFVSYDGWYSPIYMAEESVQPGRTLPRAILGGTLLIVVLYVLVNLAMLRVLPLPTLAASTLPAAEIARMILPRGGAQFVTLMALLTLLSSISALLLLAPRVLLAISRAGFFIGRAAQVSASGTPRLALALTAGAAIGLILFGTFNDIIAIAAVLLLLNYVSAYIALIVLRLLEPQLPRPYRAFGYPVTTVMVLVGSIALWVLAIAEEQRAAFCAGLWIVACVPVYLWLARRHRRGFAATDPLHRP
jgi:APA family basic amino acid/polyamine antiporter